MIYALLAYTVLRELIFWHQTQKLINKLMSRNFYDYKVTESYRPKEKTAKMPTFNGPPPDLNSLTEFTS